MDLSFETERILRYENDVLKLLESQQKNKKPKQIEGLTLAILIAIVRLF